MSSFSDKIKTSAAEWDDKTKDVEWLKMASKSTGLSRAAILAIIAVVIALVAFFGIGAGFFCNVAGFIYPAYASFKAIESHDKDDDTQWLTYWVVYAFFCIMEAFSDTILSWLPFYYVFKFAFLLWAQWPGVNGAGTVYRDILRPFLKDRQDFVDKTLRDGARVATSVGKQTLSAAKDTAVGAAKSVMKSDAAQGVVAAALASDDADNKKSD